MATKIVIKIKNSDKLIAIDEMPLGNNINIDDLDATIEVVDVPARSRRKRDRSPLHPNALTLADLRVGMKIRVCSKTLGITKYTGVIAGEPFSDDNNIGEKIPLVVIEEGPLGYEGVGYHEMYATDMGLTPYEKMSRRPWWNPTWYTVAAK